MPSVSTTQNGASRWPRQLPKAFGPAPYDARSKDVASKAQRAKQTSQSSAPGSVTKLPPANGDYFQAVSVSQLDLSTSSSAACPVLSSLPMSVESQACCFFFSNYPSQPSKNFGSVYEDMPALYYLESPDSPLQYIVTALGLAGMSHHTDTSGMEVAGGAWYYKALNTVNKSLRDRELVKLDQTLLVVLLLGLYEINTCSTSKSMKSWLNHIKGATALLDLRGEEQLNSEFGRALFIQARTQIISGCYQTRSPVPDIVVQLSRKCHERSSDPVEGLILIVFHFCSIRAQTPFCPPSTQAEVTTRATISRFTSISQALANWHDSLPAAFIPSTVFIGRASSETLSEYYYLYEDIWTAAIANNYRANSILVHEALISQLQFLRDHYTNDMDELLELEDQISHSCRTILSLIDAVCASVPSLLQSNFAAAGVGLLWVLYVCAQISPRTAPLHDATRSWIIGRLEKIGAEMGVRQATTLAGFLHKQIEVTDLLHDGSLWKDGLNSRL
ncbi:hypothetical protein B7463_g10636, partial [Scytalidium lignicola]